MQLLSSDEMWMYAPIAYNGMDIGLDLNNSQLKRWYLNSLFFFMVYYAVTADSQRDWCCGFVVNNLLFLYLFIFKIIVHLMFLSYDEFIVYDLIIKHTWNLCNSFLKIWICFCLLGLGKIEVKEDDFLIYIYFLYGLL